MAMNTFKQIALTASVMLFAVLAQAQTFTVLHDFNGQSDGSYPNAAPIVDGAGNVYGTTEEGGASGWGTVYEVDSSGTETIVFSFNGQDGGVPLASFLRDANGNLYSTTSEGGPGTGGNNRGSGVIFELSSSGNFSVLHDFNSDTDGCCSWSNLVKDKAGNFYGTALDGAYGDGTVFKLSNNGILTVLHSFAGGTKDGDNPNAGVTLDDEGNLYGTASGGGASNYGIVFKISKAGKYSILHNFSGWKTDGCDPEGGLVIDGDKNLYGTTNACGSSGIGRGDGAVFKIDARGNETLLHSFLGSDGSGPSGNLFRDQDGNLFGTTQYGGSPGGGTVYELSKEGQLTVLHNFAGGDDGSTPWGGVTGDAAGNIYGTSTEGGIGNGDGSVWEITPQ
jgi:uncharacterized repeat protein (TIGR03803 family)